MTISATTQGLRPGICLSTNRPSSPFEGQLIYETDTDLIKVWSGSSWVTVGTTPYAVASGGTTSNITAYGTSYKLHTFTSSGTFTVSTAGFVDLLVIGAGGGSSGAGAGLDAGGGGGAEPVFKYKEFLDAGAYSVVIGAGVGGFWGEKSYVSSPQSSLILYVAGGGGPGSYTGASSTTFGSAGGGGRYNNGGGGGRNLAGANGWHGAAGSAGTSGGGGGAGGSAPGTTGGPGIDISLWLGQSAGTTFRCGGGAGYGGGNGTGTGAANTGGGGPNSTGAAAGYSGIVYFRTAQ